ncbi:MAG TPA: Rne/Rng family ribonuclease [Burkholderiaceae bacterium]|nr:Rne/Rng family ribonuclease [Burkholderiaceae bacterium]
MKRMLFNATHAEELRVAIVDGQKLVDIDIETAGKESRKSNIYKGVITRIEPSLEACFINYGEERHGFLPFKEVARQYFREGVDVRSAKIQDALKEGQEVLVQLEKEERGNKGAALTTFISLAGRYLVLMPNNPKGGGVSRRIEGDDRNELREKLDQLKMPEGMSVIARTAAIDRTAEELQWDLNYLLQLWKAVDDASRSASGAFLIYQESSLVIRAIRDYFQPEIGEILIDTDDIAEQAQQFMAHVMPDMVNRVKRYRDDIPLFSRFQIEHQIETAYSRTVPLPSGGSIVIDHTEALVAIDVNSARATKGSDIEETATRTNLEAADEVARQLRLRDLGGLIVIDFIDMEEGKNQKAVEQRLKDALHYDRARVQMGRISRFGLVELSRQRLRPALNEGSHITCPRCNGVGVIRDTESSALHVLRIIQEESMKENTAAVFAQVPVDVATFLLNEKRVDIAKLEARHRITVTLIPNKHIETPHYKLERVKHDDPRLEDPTPTYEMPDAPEEVNYFDAKAEREEKPRQIAKVKGIVPDQPAPQRPPEAPPAPMAAPVPAAAKPMPVAARPAAPAAEQKGFFARMFGWLTGGKPQEAQPDIRGAVAQTHQAAQQPAAAGGEREARGGREGREGRDGRGRNGGRRDGRDGRDGRAEGRSEGRGEGRVDARGEGRDGRRNRRDGEGQEANNRQRSAEPTKLADATTAAESAAPARSEGERGERAGRGRRGRGERGDREGMRRDDAAQQATTELDASAVAAAAAAGVMASTAAASTSMQQADAATSELSDAAGEGPQPGAETGEQGERKRRRRRRGGRGRRDEQGNTTDGLDAADGVDTADTDGDQVNEPQDAVVTAAPAPVVAAAAAPAPAPAVAAPVPPAVAPAPAAAVPAAVTPATAVDRSTVRAPQVGVRADYPALDKAALEIVVARAGLSWVHTDSEKHAQVQAKMAAMPRPVRVPRERPVLPPLSTEPLVQVETKPEHRKPA